MRIGLGTAQFGYEYGITNQTGRVGRDEATAILARAEQCGIDTLDTAALYGESESSLGAAGMAACRIITKTPKFAGATSGHDARLELRGTFLRSLQRLNSRSIHGLLIHDPADLLGPFGPQIWEEMQEIKAEGLVSAIGASFYEGAQVDRALENYTLDLVQLPFNPLDQRMIEGGQLSRLVEGGAEIHARSLFLQGLLLQDPVRIPAKFHPIAVAVAQMRLLLEDLKLTMLEGILALAFQQSEIHRFICGVTSVRELDDIIAAADKAKRLEMTLSVDVPGVLDPRLLNPARWDELS